MEVDLLHIDTMLKVQYISVFFRLRHWDFGSTIQTQIHNKHAFLLCCEITKSYIFPINLTQIVKQTLQHLLNRIIKIKNETTIHYVRGPFG